MWQAAALFFLFFLTKRHCNIYVFFSRFSLLKSSARTLCMLAFFSRLTRWWNDSFYIRRHSGNLWESDGKNEYTAKTKRFWMNGRTMVAKKKNINIGVTIAFAESCAFDIYLICMLLHTWCERTCVVWYQDTFIAHQSEQKRRKQLVLCRQNIGLAWTWARLFLLRTTEKKFV